MWVLQYFSTQLELDCVVCVHKGLLRETFEDSSQLHFLMF